ncbi:MAG: carbonic anhydrase family protein [Marinifilaceae bacterium]
MRKVIIGVATVLTLAACANKQSAIQNSACAETHVITAEHVASKSPDEVIDLLKQGNTNFTLKTPCERDALAQLVESSQVGQSPLAIVLSCIDSRVPVETIFDKGLGDLFVARVAGNIVSPDMLGSMEYACEHSGSKVVVVLGHEQCGAVHSACEGVQAGNMTQMLEKIQPAIDSCKCNHEGADHEVFQKAVVHKNVELMVERVRQESDILCHLESEGKIKIVGAVFSLKTGKVEFI